MKKTNRIKAAALLLVAFMVIQLVSTCGITSLAAAQTGIVYESSFDTDFNALKDSGAWSVEPKAGPGMTLSLTPTAPTVEDGVMKFKSKNGVIFNWVDLIGGASAYDSSKTYVFEFDVKITNSGTGFQWSSNSTAYTRIMYIGFGGWFNQVEANTNASQFRVGETYTGYSASNFENKTVHYKIVLENKTATTTAYNEDGSVLSSGCRTSDSYTSMTSTNGAMKTLAIRCEDGAFELDNFSFTVKSTPVFSEVSKTSISIPSGKQAVYSAEVKHVSGEKTSVKLGSNEVFNISDAGMKICGGMVTGSYGEGSYGIKLYINPTQKMLLAEITLPDGGIVRRGVSSLASGSTVSISTLDADNVKNVKVTYQSISVADYTVVDTEPTLTGFGAKAYNLVSSFENASSDRLFAFTATSSFSDSATMALKYREKGASAWTVVDATKCDEPTNVSAENYFKVEISGLKADTEYEYQIGKKNSTATDDWSKTYTFKTAPESIDEFSFIAIGDPQGYQWSDFKYAKAALDAATKETSEPAFIFNAGDIVDSGYEAYQWNRYFKALGDYGAQFANFVAIGNHDTKNASNVLTNSDKNNYFAFHFNHPDAPENALVMDPDVYAGLSASGKVQVDNFNETIYSYNYGDAHFVVLNSGTYANTGNETYPDDAAIFEAQRAWLRNDLEENRDAKWTIVMLHEAIYHRKGGKQDRTTLADVIEEFGVDLVIEGHSHLYTRTYPMKDGQIVTKTTTDVIEKGTGTIYATIGSTTTGHDSIGDTNVELMQTIISPDNAQAAYTTVSVKGNELTLTTKQLNGLVLDSFTIVANAEEEEPEVTEPEVTEPEVTEPETTEPEVTEPEVTEPEVTEPEATEPEVTEPEVTEPEVTEPEVTEPEATEPEVTEPEVTEPENTEEVTTEEATTEEVTTEEVTTEEETTEEVTTEEVTTEEVTTEEVTTEEATTEEPEATEPEITEAETTEAEVTTEAADKGEESKETADTKAPETTEKADDKKGGCGSSVSVAGIALVATLGTCTVFVTKKKED